MATGTFYTTRVTDQNKGNEIDNKIVELEAAIVAAGSLPVSPAVAAGPWWILSTDKNAVMAGGGGVPTLDADGAIIQYSKRSGFILPMVLGSGQSIASSATPVYLSFDTDAPVSQPVYYNDGIVDTTYKYKIIAPSDGTYFFYFTMTWEDGVVYTADPTIYVYINGVELWHQTAGRLATQITQTSFFPFALQAGDTLTYKASQMNGSSLARILRGWAGMYKVAA